MPINLRLATVVLLLLLLASAGSAGAQGAAVAAATDIKQLHRETALSYFANLRQGVKLSGSVSENGSPGTFEAYFLGDSWTVRQSFGQLSSMSYDGPEGSWSGSNYAMPYRFTPEDNPASTVLNLLTGGAYLNEPHWSQFTFVDDVAGGYNFRFTPEGLPPIDIVLYSDPAQDEFLQIMSVELDISPTDPDSHTYRSYYYYETNADGELFTARETGREIDATGTTSSFSEYTVENVERITEIPEDARFSFDRVPVGGVSAQVSAPLEISVDTSAGYFIVPITFAGSDKTWNFIFDTGASASLFTPEAAAAAGLQPSITVPAHGHGSRVEFQMGLCTTASVGAADADPSQRAPLAGFPAARVSEANSDVLAAFANYDAAGILGVSMLHQYVVVFDQLLSKITLIPPHLFDAANDVPKPNVELWLDVEDLVYLTGHIGDGERRVSGDLVLDTGLQQQLAVLRETMDLNQLQLPVVASRRNTVLGGVKSFDYVKVPLVEIAVMSWPDVESSVTTDDKGTLSARGALGFLGVPFFFGTRVTLDLFGERMYVRPLEPDEMKALMEQLRDALGLPTADDEAEADEEEPAEESAEPEAEEDPRIKFYRERMREFGGDADDPDDDEDGDGE